MSRILLLGGYGGFGARIARRLAAAGHEVLVAGRSIDKARAVCADAPAFVPIACDRRAIAAALAAHRPDMLVDASGPFQAMDYAVPRACIEARVPYIDIADGRAFVCGISALDAAAQAAGVVVLSGASSVPALSGAVVRHLAVGLEHVSAVEMAISASNRATAGPAVAESILGQVGQPVRIRRGGRWLRAFGWQDMRRERFACPGAEPIDNRLVALTDVPDLALLPDRLPGAPAVIFRAGTELGFQNWALWLASWAVRWRWLRSLSPFARWLQPLQSLTRAMGSDRSAMIVRLFGYANGGRLERCWTLIADRSDGPEIPTLAVVPLAARILSGAEPPGARDAGLALTIEDFDKAFVGLAIRTNAEDKVLPPPLYERVMGSSFATLPVPVQAMHRALRDGGASGEAEVTGAAGWAGRIVAAVVGFPKAGRHPLHVHFQEDEGQETWTRDFGGKVFQSHLSQRGPWLVERFGPLRFAFALPATADGLTMNMQRWWLGPLPLPLRLAPRSRAREWAEDNRFHFDVPIALPLLGLLVHYRGWLSVR